MPFDPLKQTKRKLFWVIVKGEYYNPLQQGIPAKDVLSAVQNGNVPSVEHLKFQNPRQFVAGQLNENVRNWNFIFEQTSAPKEVRDWRERGVDLHQDISPFWDSFGGIEYNHDFPPHRILSNSNKCIPFIDFINKQSWRGCVTTHLNV